MRYAAKPLVLTLCLGLALVACAGDDASDAGSGAASSLGTGALEGVTVEGAFGEEPTVTLEPPFSATATARQVLSEGEGDVVAEGNTVVVDYVMVNGRNGEVFDSSFAAEPASIALDAGEIIPGLVDGVVGVKVGSRVLVAIPPDAGFGLVGGVAEAGVEADDTVVAVIDVQQARTPLERAAGAPVAPAPGLPTVTLGDDGAPTIAIPDGAAPTELVAHRLIEGTGPAVEAGQSISVHYTGVTWPGGEEFDSSWARPGGPSPMTLTIGEGQVIAGWDEGLVGHPVGSQVLLVIPPDKGYGPGGNAEAGIAGTDTLVFAVDILDAG